MYLRVSAPEVEAVSPVMTMPFLAAWELSVGEGSSSRFTLSVCPSERVIAFSVGTYPSAETRIVWLPGLTGRLTPSDAGGIGVLSMMTSGLVGPRTVMVTHGNRAGRAATSLLASSSALAHERGEPGA